MLSVATATPKTLRVKALVLLVVSSHVALLRDPSLSRMIAYECRERRAVVVVPPWIKTVLPDNTAVCPNVPSGDMIIVRPVTREIQTTSAASAKSMDIIICTRIVLKEWRKFKRVRKSG